MRIFVVVLMVASLVISCDDLYNGLPDSIRGNKVDPVSTLPTDSDEYAIFEVIEDQFGGINKDLGRRSLGDSLSIEYHIRNIGKKDLRIERVDPDCSCTVGTFTNDPIKPGSYGKVTLEYNVVIPNYEFYKKAKVYTNAKNGDFEISFQGHEGAVNLGLEDLSTHDEIQASDYARSPLASIVEDYTIVDGSIEDLNQRNDALQNMKAFVNAYYVALENRGDFQAYRWFANEVDQWIKMKNVTPSDINEIWNNENEDDFINQRFNVLSHTISFDRAEDEIRYYTFDVDFSCYRPSKRKRQTCMILIEMGVNADNKLVSYIEKKVTNLNFSDEY
ncbi:MAG: DUF1573 domain-containing protein [Chitinophagales bacterium]